MCCVERWGRQSASRNILSPWSDAVGHLTTTGRLYCDKITTQNHTMSSHPQSSLHPPPERGSIHAILVANPSRRLYTHPLEWKEQLEYLSYKLHPPSLSLDHKIVGDEAMQNVPPPHGSEWNDIRGAVIEIQDCRKRRSRDEQMRSLFAKLSAAATRSQLQRYASCFPPIQS